MSDPKVVEVVVAALKSEATTWDTQGDAVAGIAAWTNGQTVTGAELGMFFALGGAYETIRSEVSKWCTEGGTTMHAVAAELRRNATAYENTDVDVTQRVEGAY